MKNVQEQTIEEWYQDYDKPIKEENEMSLTMKNEGGDFELAPQGTHLATCYMVVDLGNQNTSYNNVEKVKPQVMIGWELTNEKMEDGRPFVSSRIYNAFFSEKANLRKDLESWRGKKFSEEELSGFDISVLCGIPCQITITHSEGERTYANVSAVTGLPKGVKAPALENEKVVYEEGNDIAFQKLPEWIQKKIEAAVKSEPETNSENPAPANTQDDFQDDDIPF